MASVPRTTTLRLLTGAGGGVAGGALIALGITNATPGLFGVQILLGLFVWTGIGIVLHGWAVIDRLERDIKAERHSRNQTNLRIITTLALAVDAKDHYTHDHSHRVADYSLPLSRCLGFSQERCEAVHTAGLLHDVGKIAVPDEVLLSPDPPSTQDWYVLRGHSRAGADLVSGAGFPSEAQWIYALHEDWDGGGYPEGKSAEQIPLEARMLAVCDAFEAMTSSRRYQAAMSTDDALVRLQRQSARRFDPDLIPLFSKLVRQGAVRVTGS